MATMATKNMMLSPAMTDLGMGDALKTQTQDEIDERKKKLAKLMQPAGISPATMSLLGSSANG